MKAPASSTTRSDREGMAINAANLDGSQLGETLLALTGNPEADKGDQSRWCVGIAPSSTRGAVISIGRRRVATIPGQVLSAAYCRCPPALRRPTSRHDHAVCAHTCPEPIDLDLDLTTRTMYWTDRGDNTVSSAPMDPPSSMIPQRAWTRKILLRGLGGHHPRSTLRANAWRGPTWGQLGVANLDGSNARTLLTGQGALSGICWA